LCWSFGFSHQSGRGVLKPLLIYDEDAGQGEQSQCNAHVEAHWAYHGIEGPDDWAMLTPHFSRCEMAKD